MTHIWAIRGYGSPRRGLDPTTCQEQSHAYVAAEATVVRSIQ